MNRCDWASCDRPATNHAGPWHFCTSHRNAHDEMTRRGDVRGQNLPLTKDVDPRPNHELTREQLLRAVLEESRRPVPPVPGTRVTDPMRHLRGRRAKRVA
ncbi:MAG: hypothetical protein JWM40_2954 [Frankiales bacterium]|nr:hypothetical protein [Frankiales bacterium]